MDINSDVAVCRLWQQQEREERVMPLDEIRAKAEGLDAKARRWRSVTALLFVVLVIGEALQVWLQEALLERAGDSLTIAALVYVAYRFRRQRMAAPPVALGRTNSVEFYHAELARQRDLAKDSWGYLLPFVPGVTLALFARGLGERPLSQTIAVILFGIALFLGVTWWNAFTGRRLQKEIDALEASQA
jgi:hypothetical protein